MTLNWRRHVSDFAVAAFSTGIVLAALILAAALDRHRGTPAQPAGMFEGNGAVTVGCALWDTPTVGGEYTGDRHDFALDADREDFFAVIVFTDGFTRLISGKQCGVSVDWRRLPEHERAED